MNQRLTDRPIGMSARVKAGPATKALVSVSRASRMATIRVQSFNDASICFSFAKAGFRRASAMKTMRGSGLTATGWPTAESSGES